MLQKEINEKEQNQKDRSREREKSPWFKRKHKLCKKNIGSMIELQKQNEKLVTTTILKQEIEEWQKILCGFLEIKMGCLELIYVDSNKYDDNLKRIGKSYVYRGQVRYRYEKGIHLLAVFNESDLSYLDENSFFDIIKNFDYKKYTQKDNIKFLTETLSNFSGNISSGILSTIPVMVGNNFFIKYKKLSSFITIDHRSANYEEMLAWFQLCLKDSKEIFLDSMAVLALTIKLRILQAFCSTVDHPHSEYLGNQIYIFCSLAEELQKLKTSKIK